MSSTALFGELTRRRIDDGFFRGAVLRVILCDGRGGQLLHEEAWGHAFYTEEERVPLATSTLFDMASVTKLFTTTAVLRLITQGKLALRDTVTDLLRRPCEGRGVDGRVLSRLAASLGSADVASLLSHSSGIHYWYPFYTRTNVTFEAILADVLEEHPPRKEVVYSDLNFMLLGRIIEGITRFPLAAAVESLVLRPLGLGRTSYGRPLGPAAATEFGNRIEKKMVADLGLSFEGWRDESIPIRGDADDGNCFYYFGGAAGHAGVFSDARDLCRLGQLYLDGGMVDGEAWLAPGLAKEAMRDHGGTRGLGFQLGENYPGGGCGHTGFTGTYIHVNPASNLVITILANRLHASEPRDINPFRRELSEAVLSVFR